MPTKPLHYPCAGCGNVTEHRHMHNTAHGIATTHMAGSERFECCLCGQKVFANSPQSSLFKFVLDVPLVTREVKT